MDKKVIYEYIDARELARETEEDIKKLRKQHTVQDKVSGSNPEFPYQAQSFNISGIIETYMNPEDLSHEIDLLQRQKENAVQKKLQAMKVMESAPIRMKRIIRYKVFKELTWDQVAARMGGDCSADGLRMEFKRFIEKK